MMWRGDVVDDAVWPGLDAPFRIETNINVSAALEINPGAVLEFDSGHTMSVDPDGSLASLGTPELPIFFSGVELIPGFWGGLRFYNSNQPANELLNTVFQYGGGYYEANVYLTGSTSMPSRVKIDNCFFEYSLEYGLSTSGNVIINSFSNNVLQENETGAAAMDANHVAYLDATSSFSGNVMDVVHIYSGDVYENATWPGIDVPYYIDTNVAIEADLVILPGTVLEFNNRKTMSVNSTGSLSANGTAGEPILFTGTEMIPGYWGGLRFYNSNTMANNLSHVIIEYGGGYYEGNLLVTGSAANPVRVEVRDSTFKNSKIWGTPSRLM